MPDSERDLVANAQSGSLEAFDELVALHQGQVYALARRMLGNHDDAADVQQETFVRAWSYLKSFRGNSEFATWLHRITVNLCLSRRRRVITLDESFLHEQPTQPRDLPIACLERAETAAHLRKALTGMPAHYRALIVMREIEGRPFEEVARILHCSVGSARSRAYKARNMLRERMRPFLAEEEQ